MSGKQGFDLASMRREHGLTEGETLDLAEELLDERREEIRQLRAERDKAREVMQEAYDELVRGRNMNALLGLGTWLKQGQ